MKLLKWLLGIIFALVLVLGSTALWLRYEFQRVQHTPLDETTWDKVSVESLARVNEETNACDQLYPNKKAWFGDLHVHTAASYDATSFGVTTSVDEAYAFARGTPLRIKLMQDSPEDQPPALQIRAPLDFMVISGYLPKHGSNLFFD
jgi:hypothetical protein